VSTRTPVWPYIVKYILLNHVIIQYHSYFSRGTLSVFSKVTHLMNWNAEALKRIVLELTKLTRVLRKTRVFFDDGSAKLNRVFCDLLKSISISVSLRKTNFQSLIQTLVEVMFRIQIEMFK
jgi:hypothetical protein